MFDSGVFCKKKLDASHLRVRGNFSGEEKKEKGKKESDIFFRRKEKNPKSSQAAVISEG